MGADWAVLGADTLGGWHPNGAALYRSRLTQPPKRAWMPTMAFFWSGPNASIAGIFRRSARYWVTSYVGNCLWGPPGHRGPRNPDHPGHAAWKQEQARQAVADWDALPAATKASRLRRESYEMAARLGWTEAERHAQEAAMLWSEGVGGASTRQTSTRGTAIAPSGGLKGGARPTGIANRGGGHWGGGKTKRGAAVARSGGLRGGAAGRWAH